MKTNLFRVLRWLIFLSIAIFLTHVWLLTKSYIFSADTISKISTRHAGGKDVQAAVKKIYNDLQRSYPGHILPESEKQWIFVNCGGWMGAMYVLHASITEYVMIFGTAVDTSGHSGRYWANITDTLISGEMRKWSEGVIHADKFKAGDTIFHQWGEATAVQFQADTWMVEYGRGFIPSTLSFALADSVFSTQDVLTIYYMFRIYAKGIYMEAINSVIDLKHYVS